MDNDTFEALLRSGECYHGARVPPDTWTVVRVDGRAFTRLAADYYRKPFDERFHHAMVVTAEALLRDLDGLYAYTQSDEISVLLPQDFRLFDREHEKLVSVAAGLASAAWTHETERPGHFDARVWTCDADPDATPSLVDYWLWRRANSYRCAISGLAYWALRSEGRTVRQATRELDRLNLAQRMGVLGHQRIDPQTLPSWQLWGTALYWETYTKEGVNPLTGQAVTAQRRRIALDDAVLVRSNEDYAAFLRTLLAA